MSKSKAKKKREHQLRNTGRDVTIKRSGQDIAISTHERKKPRNHHKLLKERLKKERGDDAA